jgi:hypothetical protein
MDAKIIVTHRPLSDTIMAWVDVEMSDDDYNERVVRENIGEDILVELLKVGPSHNRTRLIFSGLQVVAAGDNPGWEAFAGIVAGDGVTSLIVEAAEELRQRAVPIDVTERIMTANRTEITVPADALLVKP